MALLLEPTSQAKKASDPIEPRSPSLGLVLTSTTGSANRDPSLKATNQNLVPADVGFRPHTLYIF